MADIDKLVFHASDALEKFTEPPSEEVLLRVVRAHAAAFAVTGDGFTDVEIGEAVRKLQQQFVTSMGLGTIFAAEDYKPWLAQAQGDINFYYWNRYRQELRRQGLSKEVVRSLDKVTDEVLDHLENPKKDGRWARKGLVVGHVQSGKTANYTGLIAKASDAGFKVIIVLAGTLNSLRNQTQERLDADFMGWCTIKKKAIGSSDFGNERHPVCLTTAKEDFKKTTASITLPLGALSEPVVLVLKKNVSTLSNLRDWLNGSNRHDLKDFPMLLIDDEADHASINTNKPEEDPTSINRCIRDVLRLFPRCAFVGYTATPFANIFIDPETDDEMTKGDVYADLFPKDFIYSLDPPTNYVGASRLFVDQDPQCLRDIEADDPALRANHKITFVPQQLPDSLGEALDAFILAKAIRILRGQVNTHHSMMVNVSRFTGVQNTLRDLILEDIKAKREAINNYSALPEDIALQDSIILQLHDVFVADFAATGVTWKEVQGALKASVGPIEVISINRKGSGILDYSRDNYPDGRSLVAVGGLGLSRGLTLQGLMVSYFLRNSIMYDTLLQMGRWFGYRDNYADLCRIFMTPLSQSWYSHIAEAIEELREDFREMWREEMTPLQFGLRVRSHPTALIITARNKMRSSKAVPVRIALEGRLAETSILLNSKSALEENVRLFERLVAMAVKESSPKEVGIGWLWEKLPIGFAKELISKFRNHQESVLTDQGPLLSYINLLEKEGEGHIDLFLRSAEGRDVDVSGVKIKTMERTVASIEPKIEFTKRRVASRGDERVGLPNSQIKEALRVYQESNPGKNIPDKVYRKIRDGNGSPPLIMLMLADVSHKGVAPVVQPVAAYGISFPGDPGARVRPLRLVEYRVNTIWWQNNVFTEEEEEEE